MKYPNLNSLIKWHSYGLPTFADHANVTTDLLEAVLKGKEELTFSELWGIARLVGIGVGVLIQPKMACMRKHKYQHRAKVCDVIRRYNTIKNFRLDKRNGVADRDLYDAHVAVGKMIEYFNEDILSYCHYFAVVKKIEWNVWLYANSHCARPPRGLRNKKAPATDQSTQGEK